MTKEQIISNIKTFGIKQSSLICQDWMIKNGFEYNELVGWEEIETLEMFNLRRAKGVPVISKKIKKMVERKTEERDSYGNKTGNIITKLEETDEVVEEIKLGQNWLDYKKYKKDKENKIFKKEKSEKINNESFKNLINNLKF